MSVALAFGATVLLARPLAPPIVAAVPVPVPSDTTVAEYFALARQQFRAGDAAKGFATYLRGAEQVATAADQELYRRDAAWIATRTELAVWRSTAPKETAALVRSFWSGRDALGGHAVGARLAAHVQRLDAATAHFRVDPKRGKPPMMRVSTVTPGYPLAGALRDFVPTQGELDDRAVIYIRHGEPDARTLTMGSTIESWTYEVEGESVTVHFAEALFDGSSGNGTLIAVPPLGAFAAICLADDAYCRIGSRNGVVPPEQIERIRQHALGAIRTLTTTDR